MRYPDARLMIFAKTPVAGRVKTRLAARYGRHGAARIYRDLLQRTVATAASARVAPLELWCSPSRHPWLSALARRHDAAVRIQPPGDLGRRMERALRATTPQRPAVIIGGDCASLDTITLHAAFDALHDGVRAVFAPAEDGGYTLVGLGGPAPGLFQAMPWGGSGVMTATRRRLRRLAMPWRELTTTYDIDRPADWRRLRRATRR